MGDRGRRASAVTRPGRDVPSITAGTHRGPIPAGAGNPPVRLILPLALLLASGVSCGGDDPPASPSPPPPQPGGIRVLMVTATAGFRHDSIDAARTAMSSLAATSGEFRITATEDLSTLTASELAAFDVLFFALTSGELPLTAEQRSAILAFVAAGGGFLGAHSATDTLYGWPEYGEMVGAYFREHPWTQQAIVVVEDASHPAAAGLGSEFSILEEFYTFRDNPRPRAQVLLRLDAASVGTTGDYPLAWTRLVRAWSRLLQRAWSLLQHVAGPPLPAPTPRRHQLGHRPLTRDTGTVGVRLQRGRSEAWGLTQRSRHQGVRAGRGAGRGSALTSGRLAARSDRARASRRGKRRSRRSATRCPVVPGRTPGCRTRDRPS